MVTVHTYQNIYGSTVNYDDTFEIPGAAGNSFEVRFKGYGEGSAQYTMGGWGIDNIRVFGNSSGCTGPFVANIDWDYSDEVSGSCPQIITRTFTGSYDGTDFNCSQQITITDDVNPIFTSHQKILLNLVVQALLLLAQLPLTTVMIRLKLHKKM